MEEGIIIVSNFYSIDSFCDTECLLFVFFLLKWIAAKRRRRWWKWQERLVIICCFAWARESVAVDIPHEDSRVAASSKWIVVSTRRHAIVFSIQPESKNEWIQNWHPCYTSTRQICYLCRIQSVQIVTYCLLQIFILCLFFYWCEDGFG